MKQFFLLSIILCLAFVADAQNRKGGRDRNANPTPPKVQEGHALTYFTMDGQPFWMVIDGVRQNVEPQTNVRVTGLRQDAVQIKLIFLDETLPTHDDRRQLVGVDPGYFEQVIRVMRDSKKNKWNTRLQSFDKLTFDKERRPVNPKQQPTQETYEVPYHTDPTWQPSVRVNVPGIQIHMDVPVHDVELDMPTEQPTQPTQPQRRTQPTQPVRTQPAPAPAPAPVQAAAPAKVGCTTPMASSKFTAALNSIKNQSFSESQMKQATTVASRNCLSIKQIQSIMNTFSFESSKLEFAKLAYERCTDKDNYYLIADSFTFSSSKDELNDFIMQQE